MSTPPSATLRERPFLAGVFLVTAATLALEVLTTRLLSVLTWYSLAFLVIGMGMFGLTAGAVRVYLRADEYTEDRLGSSLARDALRFAWLVPVSYVLLLVIPLRIVNAWTTFALFLAFAGAIALPFVAAGMVVAGAVTRSPFPLGRVYAVDLSGAAVGAPLVPELLERMDAGTAIFLMSVAAAAASTCFATSAGDQRQRTTSAWWTVGLLLLTVANGTSRHALVPIWAKGRPEDPSKVAWEAWNSHSRVTVSEEAVQIPSLWGAGSRCVLPLIKQRLIVIDADAATPLYQPEHGLADLRFLDCDVTNLAHHIRPHGAAAIIGVGGSRDIQAALIAGHDPIIGIEMNRRLLEILKGPLGQPTGVPANPTVHLVHDEARSWLARSSRKFSFLQASLIDTWAATGAGAHALGENGLYTLEGWKIFLDHLEPDGVLTMSRWSSAETVRLVALAVASLLRDGATHARDHIALVSAGQVTTIIVGKKPLTPYDINVIRDVSEDKGFNILLIPGTELPPSQLTRIMDAKTLDEIDSLTLLPELDFRPPTDDRPFFFNVVRLGAFAAAITANEGGTIEGNRTATSALGLSLIASIVLAALAIVLPLASRAKPRGRIQPTLTAALGYFALIGVGFMLCEVALLQRLSLVLGHPTYSLIVVLASLIASAGIGSYFSDRLPLDRAPYCYAFPVGIASLLIALALGLPALATKIQPSSTPIRILLSAVVTSLTGLALGLAFPAGMRMVKGAHDEETPWLWGVNGVGGVVASSLAVALALSFGLTWLFVLAAACYVALVPLIVVMRRPPATPTAPP